MNATIAGISYYLPKLELTNDSIISENPDWTLDKIQNKTGIRTRWLAAAEECSSDLAFNACQQLFDTELCNPEDIEYILFCTQSPDYFLPTTACILQNRLGLPITTGALDFNLGCSGYIYGLGLAKGLINSGQTNNVLLVTAETYSKYIQKSDRSVRSIFGDGAAATFIKSSIDSGIGPFIYGTDGNGFNNLIVSKGGMRNPFVQDYIPVESNSEDNIRKPPENITENNEKTISLFMDGAEIFSFTLRAVPPLVESLLVKSSLSMDDIDFFIFHQANRYMLEALRKKIKIPIDKFLYSFEHCGNTVSSTIPIVIYDKVKEGVIRPGNRIMLVGFGVGYSWGATIIEWHP